MLSISFAHAQQHSSGHSHPHGSNPRNSPDCTITSDQESKLLALSYQDFDQSMGAGWRTYADKKCFLLCAGLLDRYRTAHESTLVPFQNQILTWHAGQMYAMLGDYKNARDRFQNSYNAAEPANTPILWNDYVSATIAFLDKDLEKLKFHRERIAQGPEFQGEKMNLAVVDGLIKCFDQPYLIAYSNSCR